MKSKYKLENKKNKCVFLDRDGVLNKDIGYLKSPDQLMIIPGVIEALKKLKEAGFLLIIVTNQSGIAKGFFYEDELKKVHEELLAIFKKNNIYINDIFYCPHHKDGTVEPYNILCDCRKPNTKMIKDAEIKYSIDLSKSYLIGDKDTDIQLAINAGLKSFYVKNDMYDYDKNVVPDYIVANLAEAAELIIKILNI
jgi:D-glycero-D-manno-heptose 1,7-bisphosphate phosphatase